MQDNIEEGPVPKLHNQIRKFGLFPAFRTKARYSLVNLRTYGLRKMWGMDIGENTAISLKALLDKTNPKGIHIGDGTAISFYAVILSHDYVRKAHLETHIGKYCQIGAKSLVMPGVTIGDHSIIGAGSVVVKDVPPRSIVVGNPGRVIRKNIHTGLWGLLSDNGEPAGKDEELNIVHIGG